MAVQPLPNESGILAQIAAGDKRAFTQLFKHYNRLVYSFSKRITESDDIALEVVQDIFIKLWLNRENLATVNNFAAYLNRVVRNHSLNVVRQQLQHARMASQISSVYADWDNSTAMQIDLNEAKRILNQAIDGLSPQQRMVYELCHQQGLKYAEVAERMNISPQTVNSYMKDALKKIRLHFRKHAMLYPLLVLALFDQ